MITVHCINLKLINRLNAACFLRSCYQYVSSKTKHGLELTLKQKLGSLAGMARPSVYEFWEESFHVGV